MGPVRATRRQRIGSLGCLGLAALALAACGGGAEDVGERVGAVLTPIAPRDRAACQQIAARGWAPTRVPDRICERAGQASWYHATIAATDREPAWLVACDATAIDASGRTVLRDRLVFHLAAIGGMFAALPVERGKETEFDWFIETVDGVPARLPIDRYQTRCDLTTVPPA
ncbi:MAG: hypothetical protein R3C15_10920 [Thermoleophilia bacterium]